MLAPSRSFDVSDNTFRNITVARQSARHIYFQLRHSGTGAARRFVRNQLQFIDCTSSGTRSATPKPLVQLQFPDWVAFDMTFRYNSFYNPLCNYDVGVPYVSAAGTRELFVDLTRNFWRDDAGVLSGSAVQERVLDGRNSGTRPFAVLSPFLLQPADTCGVDHGLPTASTTTAAPGPTTLLPATSTPAAGRTEEVMFSATGGLRNFTVPGWASSAQCGSVEAQLWGASGGVPAARTAAELADGRVGASGAGGYSRVVLPASPLSLGIWVATGGKADGTSGWPDGGAGRNGDRRSAGGGGSSRIAWGPTPDVTKLIAVAGGGGAAGSYTPSNGGEGRCCPPPRVLPMQGAWRAVVDIATTPPRHRRQP